MSTHKHLDKICCVVLAATLLLTVLFMNAEKLGIQVTESAMGYEERLFDTSTVHTIDIVMDDWDDFIENCTSEEYYACSVVIDNEAYRNVAIRGKGNTSLTQVASYGNDRYSFKIEFDHYDSSNTYYGLDKLCLNNIIQDNTYMKDYLVYQMMADFGAASPLCSYVYITVNGEDWGLYLAVEGIEESFLQRNYGSDYGELYKPDSQSMGGGRGNGKQFDMDEFLGGEEDSTDADDSADAKMTDEMPDGNMPGDGMRGGMQDGTPPDSNMPESEMPDGNGMPGDNSIPDGDIPNDGAAPDIEMPEGEMSEGNMPDGEMQDDGMPSGNMQNNDLSKGNRQGSGMQGDGMSMGSDDVLLKYIDDDFDSYSNIFDNAKTDVSDSDKERLIAALKNLSSGEDLENTVDIEQVIRYFVVHNFVLNFDSYTGSMIHNYYLYEEDGQLSMIPWDYNLAFGGFNSSDSATSLVNYPIDSPVSGGNTEDRPMIAWIFASEEYTELYHQYFAEFISEYFDSGYFSEMIDTVSSMIAPYVETDPTKFCTYEEFETGVSTLKSFCLLRAESISGQLDGTIGSTSDTQDSNTLIDAGELKISDMGSMNNGNAGGDMGGGMRNNPDGENMNENAEQPENAAQPESAEQAMMQMNSLPEQSTTNSLDSWIWVGISVIVLLLGLTFALLFRH